MRKCLCKTDYETKNVNGFILDFEKNEIYEYLKYYHNKGDINFKHYMLYFEGMPVSLDKATFDIYFVDVNKNRKLKLQRLNELSDR